MVAPEHRVNKFQLEQNKAFKLANDLKQGGRARAGAADEQKIDRREQRKQDQAKGLVPFACKLDEKLVKQLKERAEAHEGGMTEALAELLVKAGLER
ncbi:hypothetical protein BYI23_A024890 [Burkholderia sp. YI23]|nr:hypothetical protein BYI23_A024890 [Burkholderia sp. YI23]